MQIIFYELPNHIFGAENKTQLVPTFFLLFRIFMKQKVLLTKYYFCNIMTAMISRYCNKPKQIVLFTLLSQKTVTRKMKLLEFKIDQK